MSEKFTWIPFYEEMARKLVVFRDEEKRPELVNKIKELNAEWIKFIKSPAKDNDFSDIDPFTIYAIFNRSSGIEKRKAIIASLKSKFNIDADVPSDFDGIPIVNSQKSCFYYEDEKQDTIPLLWELFDAFMDGNHLLVARIFDQAQKKKGLKWNLTMAFFWMKPLEYCPMDRLSRNYLEHECGKKIDETRMSYSLYKEALDSVMQLCDGSREYKSIYEYSNKAFEYALNSQKIWLVGGSWNGRSHVEELYENNYWEGGPGKSKSQKNCLKEVKKGDLIALKTREGGMPSGETGDLKILHVGIADDDCKATKEDESWFTFRVNWYTDYSETIYSNMYKKPYNGTIGKCSDKKIKRDLIEFANEGVLKMKKTEEYVQKLANLLKKKHNIILQGAPGTGKTYKTAALALSMIGGLPVRGAESEREYHKKVMDEYEKQLIKFDEDGNIAGDGQIGFVTFHQSMDYEDFVEGIKPKTKDGAVSYNIEDGIFKALIREAKFAYIDTNRSEVKAIEKFDQIWNALIDWANEELSNNMSCGLETRNKTITKILEANYSMIKMQGESAQASTISYRAEIKKLWDVFGDKKLEEIDNFRKEFRKYVGGNCTSKYAIIKKMQEMNQNLAEFARTDNYSLQKKIELIALLKNEDFRKNDVKNYVLIIDEINRGNVSKIFGELISLLEADKRVGGDHPLTVTLPYSKEPFSVPSNLYIIGTMNTTDRSVGSIDYAVRRRFAFVTLEADENKVPEGSARNLFNAVKNFLNKSKYDMDIEDLMVGHSYFMVDDEDSLNMKWQYEILPLLMEYHKDGIIKESPLKAFSEEDVKKVKVDYKLFIEKWPEK